VKIALGVSLYVNFNKEKKKRKAQFEIQRKSIINRPTQEDLQNKEKERKSVGAFFQGKNPYAIK